MSFLTCISRAIKKYETDVTVYRPRAGAHDRHGRYEKQGRDTVPIRAAVQPARPEEMVDVEEGRRNREAIKLYTQTELYTSKTSAMQQPDIVSWDGAEFQVDSVTDWEDVGGYFKAIATRTGQ